MAIDFIHPPGLIINKDLDLNKAKEYQNTWSKLIDIERPLPKPISYIAGADIGYDYKSNQAFAVAVLLDATTFELVEQSFAKLEIQIPYQPGFLSFREVPVISMALAQLKNKPDLIVCDGQGIAHPRRFGLACHLGLALNLPTIGCGKSRLYGKALEPGNERGDYSYLYNFKKEIIGAVLRTRTNVKPLYISVGHQITLKESLDWVLKLSPKYRLPLTTRFADSLAHQYKLLEIAKGHFV